MWKLAVPRDKKSPETGTIFALASLGRTLRSKRRATDLTQAALAKRAGIAERTVRELEAGGGSVKALHAALGALAHELTARDNAVPLKGHVRTLMKRAKAAGVRLVVRPVGSIETWSADPKFMAKLYPIFRFTLDPCSPDPPTVKCRKWFTAADDGLSHAWFGTVYMNPPFSAIRQWVGKALEELQAGRASTIVALLPHNPETKIWDDIIVSAAAVFLVGRLKFGGAKSHAKFPLALVVWGASENQLVKLSREWRREHFDPTWAAEAAE